MAVYPFYSEIDSPNRRSMCGAGCRAKEGTLDTTVYVRDEGSIATAVKIHQWGEYDKENPKVYLLHTDVMVDGKTIHRKTTKY